MRHLATMAGYSVREFNVRDADDAAEKMAELAWDDSGGEMPIEDEVDVTVMSPDGAVTRHLVTMEAVVNFYAGAHDLEPADDVVAELREVQASIAADGAR